MERGWRTGDPMRGDLAGSARPDGTARAAARGAAGALPARRRPRRRPARARGDRGGGAGRRASAASTRRRGPTRATRTRVTARPTRTCARCCATSPRGGSTSSTPCRATSASGSAACEEYDFLEPAARERFDELVERLRSRSSTSSWRGCPTRSESMTPEDLAANREMVRDLNELIRERIGGANPMPASSSPSTAASSRAPGPSTTSSTSSPQRMAAMQSLLRSMSPQQRAELQSMMDALLRDDRLRWSTSPELASNLDLLLPGGLGERVRVRRRRAARARGRAGPDRPAPGAGAGWRTSLADIDGAGRSRRDRSGRGARPPRRRCGARPRRARCARSPARGGRLPDPRRRAASS